MHHLEWSLRSGEPPVGRKFVLRRFPDRSAPQAAKAFGKTHVMAGRPENIKVTITVNP